MSNTMLDILETLEAQSICKDKVTLNAIRNRQRPGRF